MILIVAGGAEQVQASKRTKEPRIRQVSSYEITPRLFLKTRLIDFRCQGTIDV